MAYGFIEERRKVKRAGNIVFSAAGRTLESGTKQIYGLLKKGASWTLRFGEGDAGGVGGDGD